MISLVREVAERMHPPRVLHCEFPLGRPLGKPKDPAFQRRVLTTALALLERQSGPVFETFPDRIADDPDVPVSCNVPPRFDPSLPPAIGEALALRPAYERRFRADGRTNVGKAISADGVGDAIAAFIRIADGVPWEDAELPGPIMAVAADLRAYYEEAAMALAGHVPAARQAESWYFRQTQTGSLMRRAQDALRRGGAEHMIWFFLVPIPQHTGDWPATLPGE